MKRFEKFMRWMNVLVIFATFFAYLAPLVNPIRFWGFSFFGLIYPWLLLTNILFVIYWSILKKKYFLFSLGCILLGWGHVKSFVGLNSFDKVKTKEVITVASYNIHGLLSLDLGPMSALEKEKKKNEFVQFLKRENEIQILCTQESPKPGTIKFIKNKFNFNYEVSQNGKSPAIFSKFPIYNSGIIDFAKNMNSCVWADLKINDQSIRVYSLHFQSNQISTIANKVIDDGDLGKKETFINIKGMMGRFILYLSRRANQAQQVANHIATCPHPVIVCGDFNDTPQSYTYHLLTQKLKDSFKEKGRGFGTTYAGRIPALRIDYILLNEKINIHSHEILKGNFSDHYPVICKISI